MLNPMSYTAFRNNLASAVDQVNDDHKPILITRRQGKPAVLMSLEDFQAFSETAYLMASPKNAERLNSAMAAIREKKTIQQPLIEEE